MHASGQRLPSWHFLVNVTERYSPALSQTSRRQRVKRESLVTRLGNTHKLMRSPLSTQEQPIFIRLRTYPVGPVCPPYPPLLTQEFLLREKLLLTLG